MQSNCWHMQAGAGFPAHLPGGPRVWRPIQAVTGLDEDTTDLKRSPRWQQPRPQQQLHLSESLQERDTEARTAREAGGASERDCAHVLLPLQLHFWVLKHQTLWSTVQDIMWYSTNSKIRDSKPNQGSISILTIYETSKETQDDEAAVFLDLSIGNKYNYAPFGALENESEYAQHVWNRKV